MISGWLLDLKQEYELEHLPNNPQAEDWKIGLSELEWQDVCNSKPLDSSKLFPWFYQQLDLPLEKRRPPPPPPKDENAEVVEEPPKPPTPP